MRNPDPLIYADSLYTSMGREQALKVVELTIKYVDQDYADSTYKKGKLNYLNQVRDALVAKPQSAEEYDL